jgi:hypothetical protein
VGWAGRGGEARKRRREEDVGEDGGVAGKPEEVREDGVCARRGRGGAGTGAGAGAGGDQEPRDRGKEGREGPLSDGQEGAGCVGKGKDAEEEVVEVEEETNEDISDRGAMQMVVGKEKAEAREEEEEEAKQAAKQGTPSSLRKQHPGSASGKKKSLLCVRDGKKSLLCVRERDGGKKLVCSLKKLCL